MKSPRVRASYQLSVSSVSPPVTLFLLISLPVTCCLLVSHLVTISLIRLIKFVAAFINLIIRSILTFSSFIKAGNRRRKAPVLNEFHITAIRSTLSCSALIIAVKMCSLSTNDLLTLPSYSSFISPSGFAVNLQVILTNPRAQFKRRGSQPGMQESDFLKQITKVTELEPKANNCTRVSHSNIFTSTTPLLTKLGHCVK